MTDRDRLPARYRELVPGELPRRAGEGRWVVTADRCSGRIVPDTVAGGRWCDAPDRQPEPAS